MKPLPKISVVIPSYNKGKYIRETLESIVSQEYPNLEVIIQDGGSVDRSVEIIQEYAKKHPKIISWVSRKDDGQTDAINTGFRKATGDIVTFINADDVYEKGALNEVGKYFTEYPDTPWLAGKGKVIDGEGKERSMLVTFYKNLLLKINIYPLLLAVNYLMQPSVFLARDTYQKYGPFVGARKYVMEYVMWLKIGKKVMPKVINNYLSSFRITEETISATLYKKLLAEDYKIAARFTKNPGVLLLHKIHNFGREAIINFIKI